MNPVRGIETKKHQTRNFVQGCFLFMNPVRGIETYYYLSLIGRLG